MSGNFLKKSWTPSTNLATKLGPPSGRVIDARRDRSANNRGVVQAGLDGLQEIADGMSVQAANVFGYKRNPMDVSSDMMEKYNQDYLARQAAQQRSNGEAKVIQYDPYGKGRATLKQDTIPEKRKRNTGA